MELLNVALHKLYLEPKQSGVCIGVRFLFKDLSLACDVAMDNVYEF